MFDPIKLSVDINADSVSVWDALTNPEAIKKWMGEPELKLRIETTWEEQNPVIFSGFHHVNFVNNGVVLKNIPGKELAYTHRSSISRLPDSPENYTELRYLLSPEGAGTRLSFVASNFPTESIYKHLAFYWRNTLPVIKSFVETAY